MSLNNPSIMSNNALEKVTGWFETINNVIKGFGIIAGGLAASLADWVTGSIALSVLFSGVELPKPFTPIIIGTIWSLGAWGVQLLLWEMILSGNMNKGLWKGKWGNALAVGGAVVLKVCDDIIDLLAIFYMLQNNTIQGFMNKDTYLLITGVVYILSWILVGFSEIFVSISIHMLRGNRSSQPSNQSRSSNSGGFFNRKKSKRSTYHPAYLNDNIISQLPKSK
jgi:hypothetical protein